MYLLILLIHGIFFGIAFFMESFFLQGLFLLLGLFFLFYFSPLFFSEKGVYVTGDSYVDRLSTSTRRFISQLSPDQSLLIPLILLYIGVFIFLFALFGSDKNILLWSVVVIGGYALFCVYVAIFGQKYKKPVFFDFFRYHTIFSLSSALLVVFSYFVLHTENILFLFLSLSLNLIAITYLLFGRENEKPYVVYLGLLNLYTWVYFLFLFIFPSIGWFEFFSIWVIGSIVLFETAPKTYLTFPYLEEIRYMSLILVLTLMLYFFYESFFRLSESVVILTGIMVFLLSIHVRYTNMIAYVTGLFSVYFLYAILFYSLLSSGVLFSVLLFVLFLPVLLIAVTYFIDEIHQYDFRILHWSSIGFSVFFALLALIVVPWGGQILFFMALSIFGISGLFFMSYFRLRSI